MGSGLLFHYTDGEGFKAVSSQVEWCFRAGAPPADHPFGAYFTALPPGERKLAKHLGIPKRKLEYVFCFFDSGDLRSIDGDRGRRRFSLYSPTDYLVGRHRQVYCGLTSEYGEVKA